MSTMFDDLLAAQKDMPSLERSADNPFYNSKYVPLETLMPAVLAVLNRHNFVLMQLPVDHGLRTVLMHSSGEVIESTMSLCASKDDPQGQGSAITYARRYALQSMFGIVAETDDDGNATVARNEPKAQHVTPPRLPSQRQQNGPGPAPRCPLHHSPMKFWPAGKSKAGKDISANWKCPVQGCKDPKTGYPFGMWDNDWQAEQMMEAASGYDPDEVPFE